MTIWFTTLCLVKDELAARNHGGSSVPTLPARVPKLPISSLDLLFYEYSYCSKYYKVICLLAQDTARLFRVFMTPSNKPLLNQQTIMPKLLNAE